MRMNKYKPNMIDYFLWGNMNIIAYHAKITLGAIVNSIPLKSKSTNE